MGLRLKQLPTLKKINIFNEILTLRVSKEIQQQKHENSIINYIKYKKCMLSAIKTHPLSKANIRKENFLWLKIFLSYPGLLFSGLL